jgi:HK97 family phage major capsid protein
MTSTDSAKMALNRELASLNADATTLRKYATGKTKSLSEMQVSQWNCDAQLGRFLAGEDAGAIREVSDETQRRNPNFRSVGYALPLDILAERDLSAAGAGSQFVSPSLTLGKVSDGLRQLDPILSLGVDIQEIQSLGNVAVPLEEAVTTGQWLSENGSQSTQQNTPSFSTATLTNFRHFSAQYDASNSWVKRAAIDGGAREWFKRDLRKTVALTLAKAVLVGSGALDPLGIVNRTPGSGSISSTTVGNPTTWAQVVAFDQIVETLNAHAVDSTTGFVLNPNTKQSWAQTTKVNASSTNGFLLDWDSKRVNGHPAAATNLIGNNLVFSSRWSSVLVLIPGTIGIVVDDRTQAHRDVTRFTIDVLADVVLRRPESIVIATTTF